MLVGFGQDIVSVARIEKTLARYGARFLERIYSESEREYCMANCNPGAHLAARFGAKEAFIKAVGTRAGIRWIDIEVARSNDGKPELILHGNAKKIAMEKGVVKTHLTLAHDGGLGIAGVILEG